MPPPRRKGPPPRRVNLAELRLNPDKPNLKIPIQDNLFGHTEEESGSKRVYTTKITAPLYKPSGIKPNILNLIDKHKTEELLRHIDASEVSDVEKLFLIDAAMRHNVFYYNAIADYYAQCSPEMQRLMEESALVIIDFDAALQRGFVRYTNEIAKIYAKEHERD